jgi:hypothetical protein
LPGCDRVGRGPTFQSEGGVNTNAASSDTEEATEVEQTFKGFVIFKLRLKDEVFEKLPVQ